MPFMQHQDIKYKTKTAALKDIFLCLSKSSQLFSVPLDKRVNIRAYTQKLFERSITFEAWIDHELVGLAAVYFDDKRSDSAFITHFGVLKDYQKLGVGSKLMNMCIEYAKAKGFQSLILEVYKQDQYAVAFYNAFGYKNVFEKEKIFIMKKEII